MFYLSGYLFLFFFNSITCIMVGLLKMVPDTHDSAVYYVGEHNGLDLVHQQGIFSSLKSFIASYLVLMCIVCTDA